MIPNESCAQYGDGMETEPSGGGRQQSHLGLSGISGGCVSPSSTHSSMEPSRLDRGISNEEGDDENNEENGNGNLDECSGSQVTGDAQSAARELLAVKPSGAAASCRRSLLTLSPLAVACRSSSPSVKTVRAILEVYPSQVRSCRNASVGTPLHEAASNAAAGYGVIDVLLTADEELDGGVPSRVWQDGTAPPSSVRAALMQDADGSVPLHLLVRRAFLCSCCSPSSPGAGTFRATAASMTAGRKRQRPQGSQGDQPVPDDAVVSDDEEEILAIVRRMVQSSPSSVGVADLREFEETPLVTALKGSTLYNGSMTPPRPPSPMPSLNHIRSPDTSQILSFQNVLSYPSASASVVSDGERTGTSVDYFTGTLTSFAQYDPMGVHAVPHFADSKTLRIEHLTYQIVRIMLAAYPEAALADLLPTSFPQRSSSSASEQECRPDQQRRGEPFAPYTPLHSAVFHGRCVETVRLLVDADIRASQASAGAQVYECPPTSVSALRPNGFGELALHVAAMRAESARLIRLLADAEPRSVFARDRKNALTPLHWLWMRFVDRLTEGLDDRMSVSDVVFFSLERDGKSIDSHLTQTDDGREIRSGSTLEEPTGSVGLFPKTSGSEEEQAEKRTLTGESSTVDVTSDGRSTAARYGESLLSSASLFLPPSFFCLHSPMDRIVSSPDREDIEADHFDAEYNHASRQWIDRPLTFERMRHVSSGYRDYEGKCAEHVYKVLSSLLADGMHPTRFHDTKSDLAQSVRGLKRRRESIGKTTRDDDAYTSSASSSPLRPAAEVVVITHFWAKVVAIIRGFARTQNYTRIQKAMELSDADMETKLPARSTGFGEDKSDRSLSEMFFLVHAACAASACPPSLARVCMSLYPSELRRIDCNGMLPLHHAACRDWHPRDVLRSLSPRKKGPGRPSAGCRRQASAPEKPHLLFGESLTGFRHVLAGSPPQAASTHDKEGRLPLHYAIDSVMSVLMLLLPGMRQQCRDHDPTNSRNIRFFFQSSEDDANNSPLVVDAGVVLRFIRIAVAAFPEALARRDGRTKMFPFMQAASAAAAAVEMKEIPGCDCLKENSSTKAFLQSTILGADETATSVVYFLLRENPVLVQRGLSSSPRQVNDTPRI